MWTNVTSTAGTAPSPRGYPAVAYDASDGYVVLAGGFGPSSSVLTDIWSFHSGRWTEISASGLPVALQGQCGLTAAYDSTTHFVLFLSANCNSGASGGRAQSYAGGNWTDLSTNSTTSQPIQTPGYEEALLVDDPQLGGLLLHGGANLYGYAVNETELYAGGVWVNDASNLTGFPPPAVFRAGAYDPPFGGLVTYGGYAPGVAGSFATSTWTLTNKSWQNDSSIPAPLSTQGTGRLLSSSADSALYWFGGYDNETWSWGSSAVLRSVSIHIDPSPVAIGHQASFSSTVVGGTLPFRYSWNLGDGTLSTLSSLPHAYASAGVFAVSLSVTDGVGHDVVSTVNLTVLSTVTGSFVVSPSPTDVGVVTHFAAVAAGGSGLASYAWSFGDGGMGNGSSVTHTYQASGTLSVILTISDSSGSSNSTLLQLTVNPAMSAVFVAVNPSSPSLGELVNLTASSKGGTPTYAYSWAFGDGGVGGDLMQISHVFTTNGPFVVRVNVTDSAGATILGETNVSISLNLTISANWSVGAAPLDVGFVSSVTGGQQSYTYAWDFGDGGNSNLASPAHAYTNSGQFTAFATVTDGRGYHAGASHSIYLVAASGSLLSVGLDATKTSLSPGSSSIIQASITGGQGGFTLNWSTSSLGCQSQGPLVEICSPSVNGTFEIGLAVSDQAGHHATSSVTLQVGSGSPQGLGPLEGSNAPWFGLGAVGVGALVVLVLTRMRHAARPVPGRRPGIDLSGRTPANVGSGSTTRPQSPEELRPRNGRQNTGADAPPDSNDPLSDLR